MEIALDTPVVYLKGIGEQRALLLAERGITVAADLLNHLPFRYEDRLHFTPIKKLIPGEVATVLAYVDSGGAVRFRGSASSTYHLMVRDATGVLYARFFHGAYLEKVFRSGQKTVLHGKVAIDPARPARLEMVNPEFELLGGNRAQEPADSTEAGRIVPIYEAIGKISPRMLRRIIYALLKQLSPAIPDRLPAYLRERHGLPSRREALNLVHFPPAETSLEDLNAFRTPGHQRLIFEEFFFYQLGMAARRRQKQQEKGLVMRVREDRVREAVKRILPFKPTGAQKRALAEIVADLERAAPMHRLLEGDVGCGKTLVALQAAAIVMENGCQVALMAPTEILAMQHFLSARRILAAAGYGVELLISGLPRAEKSAAVQRIGNGQAQFVIGTHALIEQAVDFARLGLVIVDEQHRFGVVQRKKLIEKGPSPHVLVMTATPIPRTLALTLDGDLDLSVIDELPPGRAPIETRWSQEEKLPGVWEFVRRQLAAGRQAYIVYPVVEESKQELKAATAEYQRLQKNTFPGHKTGLLHGQLRRDEKDSVMEQFRRGALQVLVATTVIEVGVDVPNATVMVIEHADRFGLAQLHQLRGRIGRGSAKSYCVLIAPTNVSDTARQRLETMVATTNGFEIAEKDLELRGPGEFFGTRQHGDFPFYFAHPLRDRHLLKLAREEAFAMFGDAQRAGEVRSLMASLGPDWQKRYQLAAIG